MYKRQPSIERTAETHTIDYDLKPSNSSRVYGWVSQVNTEELGNKKTGYGFRSLVTNRFSDKLFGLLVFNYLDENFNINDMGYVEQYGNSFIGTYLQYSNPTNDEASNISQQNYALRMGYDRSYQGFGGGVGATLEYELSFKNSSRLEIECNCTLFRGKDYVETRNYIDSPYLESLGNHELEIEYSTPRTNMFQHRFKLGYETSGYETSDTNSDLRSEGHTIGYGILMKISENLKIFLSPLEYQTQSNWSVWRTDNLFGYYDKEMISSGINLDWFIGDRQEIRLKGKIYGIKANQARAYRADSSGYLNASNDSLDPFELSETAFQVRYKYQFAPLSDLYVVYTRGGKYNFSRENSFEKIYSGAWSNQNLDKFIVKLRYKL